jgi:hypothetical protein
LKLHEAHGSSPERGRRRGRRGGAGERGLRVLQEGRPWWGELDPCAAVSSVVCVRGCAWLCSDVSLCFVRLVVRVREKAAGRRRRREENKRKKKKRKEKKKKKRKKYEKFLKLKSSKK